MNRVLSCGTCFVLSAEADAVSQRLSSMLTVHTKLNIIVSPLRATILRVSGSVCLESLFTSCISVTLL